VLISTLITSQAMTSNTKDKSGSGFRTNDRAHHALGGVLFGLCFPVISTFFDMAVQGIEVNWANIVATQVNQPLHWVIDSAPLFLGLFAYWIGVRQEKLKVANKKVMDILYNTLPWQIADEILEHGVSKPRYYEHVTVLFVDIKGFTQMATESSPKQLVEELDQYFSLFDQIVGLYGVEKIKTIGDAFMAAGGLPDPTRTNTSEVVRSAIEIRDKTLELNNERAKKGKRTFDIRIGIHSGPVVAGLIGKRKYSYDVWGDTVNTASRIENTAVPMKVTISKATHDLIRHDFSCRSKGIVDLKGKGQLEIFEAEFKGSTVINLARETT
jgi:class 3 adenylate cyclase